jgi:hypothetical protein
MISKWVKTMLVGGLVAGVAAAAQDSKEPHWRKYKKLEPAAKITITVEKAANGKPIENAGVVFHAIDKYGKDEGGLEIKSDPDGHASLDVIEIGSHVKVQVIAQGYATAAVEFDVPTDTKDVTVRMERPKAQISVYQDNDGKPLQRAPGVQEPAYLARPKTPKPDAVKPGAAGTTLPAAGAQTGTTLPPAPVSPPANPDAPATGTTAPAATTAPATTAPAATTSGNPTGSPR